MTEMVFTQEFGTIYAAFSKNPPTKTMRDTLFKRIEHLPDGFMIYARQQLQELESLPQNLGRYILRHLWPDYLDAHPELRSRRQEYSCSLCNQDTPGFRRVYSADFRECTLRKCPCNHDPRRASAIAWTDDLIHERGLRTARDFLEWSKGEMPHLPEKFRDAIGNNEPPRERHANYLRKMEGAW